MNLTGELGTQTPPPVLRKKTGAISVKRGFGWNLAGYISLMACQLAMVVVLSRMGSRDQTDVGLFSLALAIVAPIVLFSNMNLRRVFATDATGSHRFGDYFTLRMVTNLVALGLIAAAVLVPNHRAELVWATFAMAAAKMVESTSDILHGYFQERRRIDIGSRGTIFRAVLTFIAFFAVFAATGSVIGAILATAVAGAAVLAFYEWPQTVKFLREEARETGPVPKAPARGWLRLLKTAVPLGIVALVISLKGNIPIYVIEHSLGAASVGIFAALLYFYNGSSRVISALGEATAERMAALHASADKSGVTRFLKRMLGVSLLVSVLGIGGSILLGRFILGILYPDMLKLYPGMPGLFVAIMASAIVSNIQVVFDYAMMATRNFKIQPYVYGASALLLLILCAVFVPSMGLSGAALALGIVSGLELVATFAVVWWAVYGRKPQVMTIVEAGV